MAGAAVVAGPALGMADEGGGVLSAGCISTTQLVAKVMSRVVSVNVIALGFTVASGEDNKAPGTPTSQTTTAEADAGQPGHRSI